VRPEDVRVTTSELARGVRCRVELLESMGAMNILYATTGSDRLIATTEPAFQAAPGEAVWLAFDEQKLHLFDRTTERNLLATGA
jgi:multiple sugar transport system ATP-binding protein